MGVEVGFKVPTYLVDNLSVQGVVSYGRYEYTSTPTMIQTLDNTAEEVSFNGQTEIPVRYWKEHPVYGPQFSVSRCQAVRPRGREALIRYDPVFGDTAEHLRIGIFVVTTVHVIARIIIF